METKKWNVLDVRCGKIKAEGEIRECTDDIEITVLKYVGGKRKFNYVLIPKNVFFSFINSGAKK